jgi:hypothetical protein
MLSQSTSFAEASPAKTSAPLARAQASTGNSRGSGRSSLDSFASYDPTTSSWRTSQLCLDGALDEFSETWPRAGMTQSGTAYQLLVPLAPLTKEIGSGSWPTPRASADRTGRDSLKARHWAAFSLAQMVEVTLGILPRELDSWDQVPGYARDMMRRWPTPKSSPSGPDLARANRKGSGGDDLATAVARETWATPTRSSMEHPGRVKLKPGQQVGLSMQVGGALNPPWVEWLMGFPLGWTDLGASAMRSSRRSRSGLAGESSNGRR